MEKIIKKIGKETNVKFSEVSVNVSETQETRKPAFAFFNRDVNLRHVDLIFEKMKVKGYRSSEPIQVMKAEETGKQGVYAMSDLNGNEIPKEKFELYYLVIEGQHRTYAVSKYNDWLESERNETKEVPAIEVKFQKGESLIEYLNEINITQKEWTKEDFLKGAANINTKNELLQRYKKLIRTDSNPQGYSLSTLNLIFCNSGSLTKNDFVLLCAGKTQKGKKGRDIIPDYDLQTGDQFIEICRNVGFRKSDIAKRYLIQEFNRIKNSKGKEEAIKILETLTPVDVNAMLNESERLDEDKVISRFEEIKSEYYASDKKEEGKESEVPETNVE